jgi:molybdopterin molybdotransferase
VISVQQTIDLLKKNQPDKKITEINLMDSPGMVLAQPVVATLSSPPYTNSAMDGFAVRWQDVHKAGPETPIDLEIVGESSAGFPYDGQIIHNQAIRISTGAIVPDDADTVIPIEHCSVGQDKVRITIVSKKNQHLRFMGEEYKKGDELLDPGVEINSAHIALIAALGIARIKVYKKASVIIMSTGSELVPFDQPAESHQLRDSNTPMLISAVNEAGGNLVYNVHVKDDAQLTLKTIKDASQKADLIISSGGVSMGRHDHVRDMALKAGFKELFWKIKQKPGKPMFLAKKNRVLLIALPGNPVSAYICFKHYIRPLLQSIRGKNFDWPVQKAWLTDDIENTMDRTHLMRVKLNISAGKLTIIVLDKQGSHMSSSIAQANGYIILNEGAFLKKDSEVEVYLF